MNNFQSLLRGYGYSGVIISLIWVLARFKVLALNNFEILSIAVVVVSITTFYFFSGEKNLFVLLISIFLFFTGIALTIFFNQNEVNNNRLIFDFKFLVTIGFFTFGTFFLTQLFESQQKILKLILAIIFFSGIFVYKFLSDFVFTKILNNKTISLLDDIGSYIISFLLLTLIIFPIKNIISALKSKD